MSVADDSEIEQNVTDLDATPENVAVKAGPDQKPSVIRDAPNPGRATPKTSRVTFPEHEKKTPPPDTPRASHWPSPGDVLKGIYNHPYRWEVFTCTAVFLLALEMTRELWGVAFPLRVYRPFWRIIETYKCIAKTWNK